MATTTKEKMNSVPPFGIEIDSPKNNDVKIQCIPGCKLRGAVKHRPHSRPIPMMPDIPGMQLHVNPAKGTYAIIDPLYDDLEKCETIRSLMEQSEQATYIPGKGLVGVAPQEGNLDVDWMKTLCREMFWLLDTGYAVLVKGPPPDMEDIDGLDGRYLQNPGSVVANSQPKYEDEMDAWQRQLSMSGR